MHAAFLTSNFIPIQMYLDLTMHIRAFTYLSKDVIEDYG